MGTGKTATDFGADFGSKSLLNADVDEPKVPTYVLYRSELIYLAKGLAKAIIWNDLWNIFCGGDDKYSSFAEHRLALARPLLGEEAFNKIWDDAYAECFDPEELRILKTGTPEEKKALLKSYEYDPADEQIAEVDREKEARLVASLRSVNARE